MTINGKPFDEVLYPLARPGVAKIFWQRPGADQSGFECRASVDNAYPKGRLEIQRVNPGSSALERGRDSMSMPDPGLHLNLPDENRRFRVIGNRDPQGFLATGLTDFFRLDHAALTVSGKHMYEHNSVLDWGCGCGRVARHFPTERGGHFTGCDIDHDNIKWCQDQLGQGGATFMPSDLVPPLPFADRSFDLVYGISVFTHFREPLQMQWLKELARVTADGALLLLTIHGPTAVEFAGLDEAVYRDLSEKISRQGILDNGSNSQIDGYAKHDGEYVNVFHDHDYVRKTWGRFFEVTAIVPGYIFTHDLVVLRKRG